MKSRQLDRVRSQMLRHGWITLSSLAALVKAPEGSVSARLRDLRKRKFGAYTVQRRWHRGAYQYRLGAG